MSFIKPLNLSVNALLLTMLGVSNGGQAVESEYVARSQCAECHIDQVELWQGSHHDLAMQVANSDTVSGDFDDAKFTHFTVTSKFYKDGDRYFIQTDGPEGELTEYEIKYTFGVDPLQQYLVEFPGGRLQALPLAWDSRPTEQGGQRWFHLNPGEPITHDDPLHWTGPALNWNNMCAECHSTDYSKGYDVEPNSYQSVWSEIDVSCEACHGPGSEHVKWARQNSENSSLAEDMGLVVDLNERAERDWDLQSGIARRTSARSPMMQIETCGLCHSRRGTTGISYQHGETLIHSHRVQTLESDLYFPDGQIKDEVYVYGSFLQSKMFADGVVCSDCHDPHSLALRAEGNNVCATCHMPDKFDTIAHHHHEPGSEGAQCVGCHMTARTYMVIDDRRDHSFRIPRPDVSAQVGSPDACTGCHKDRDPDWAADIIKDSWGGASHKSPHFATVFDAADKGSLASEPELLRLAGDTSQPGIVRASAVSRLQGFVSSATLQSLPSFASDPDPMIRLSALPMLESIEPQYRVVMAGELLNDPVRSVRLESAWMLADVQPELLSEDLQIKLSEEIAEYVASQTRESDVAGNNINLGNLYTRFGVYSDAEEWYLRAIKLNPHYIPSYINLADLYRLQGEDAKGEAVLNGALEQFPGSGALHHAYGLLLIRLGNHESARSALLEAVELAPENTRYRYVYAIALHSEGKILEAIKMLEEAYEISPADSNTLNALISFNQQIKNRDKVIKYATALSERFPWDQNLKAFLQQQKLN